MLAKFPQNWAMTGIFKCFIIDLGTRSSIKTCFPKFKRLHKIRGLHAIHKKSDELRNGAVETEWI